MRKGLIRLGILLTAIWASGVIGLLTYEYKAQDPPYQYQRQEGPFDDILGIDLLPKSRYLL